MFLRSLVVFGVLALAIPPQDVSVATPIDYTVLGLTVVFGMAIVKIAERLIEKFSPNGRNGQIEALKRIEAGLNSCCSILSLIQERQKAQHKAAEKDREEIAEILRVIEKRVA